MMMHPIRYAIVVGLSLLGTVAAEEPAKVKPYSIVTPKREAIEATGINTHGQIVGFQWMPENGNPDILYEAPIYARGTEITPLPLLKGYTANFPAALSDDGVVVGRVSKPAPPNVFVNLRNQAYVWDRQRGIRGLGAPEGDTASFATGISRDGRRISGLSVGNYRLRGCLWERVGEGEGESWKTVIVPDADALGSNVLAISDDGKRLAAVQKGLPTLWTETAPGVWRHETLSDEPNGLIPRGVNNAGMVVGRREDPQGRTHAVVWTPEEGVKQLHKPQGYEHSMANAVNNAGVVVGQIDGPHGSKVGPNAFVYEAGRLRILDEGGPYFVSATAINDAGQIAGVFEKEEEEATKPEKTP
ncbi:HAF repeat-containing protein [Paludisphaera borealis]|uniref:Uncharacterized protein n=1 Tax=Paludisphaera borealis TaxID=1387353 RepID=A0A1U7CT24_9BACT|nr:HAF repeat-containing protein [Paludisphaera borealis]APW62081.1 hypothetical protein BSF38_03613 [Paludisphaera borealis]